MKRKSTIPDKYSGFAQFTKLPKKYQDSNKIKDKRLDSQKFKASNVQIKTVNSIQQYQSQHKKQYQVIESNQNQMTASNKFVIMKQMLNNFNQEVMVQQNCIRQKFYKQLADCLSQVDLLERDNDQQQMSNKLYDWMNQFKRKNSQYFQNETPTSDNQSFASLQTTARTSIRHGFFPKQTKQKSFKRLLNDEVLKTDQQLSEEEILKEMDKLWIQNQLKKANETKQDQEFRGAMRNWSSQSAKLKTESQRKRDITAIQRIQQKESLKKADFQTQQIGDKFLGKKNQKQSNKKLRYEDTPSIFKDDKLQQPSIFKNNIQQTQGIKSILQNKKQEKINQLRENYKNILPTKYQDNQLKQNYSYRSNLQQPQDRQRPFSQVSSCTQAKQEIKAIRRKLNSSNIYVSNKTLENALTIPRQLSPHKLHNIQLTGSSLISNPFCIEKQKKKKRASTSKK